MSIITTDSKHYNDIARAIQEKTGSTDTYKPGEMAGAIRGIEGGGGSSVDAITIGADGTIKAIEVGDGHVPVVLAVPVENYNNAEGVSF